MFQQSKRSSSNPPAFMQKEKKKATLKVSGTVVQSLHLTQVTELGEYAVVNVSGPTGTKQFTVCRPIGITDLSAEREWILLPTGEVLGALAKVTDPGQGELNQARTKHTSEAATAAGHTVRGDDGKIYYPGLSDKDRNTYRQEAEAKLKVEAARIKGTLPEKPTKAEKGTIRDQLNRLHWSDFLPKEAQTAEHKLSKFLKSPATILEAEKAFPQEYYTPVGPYGDAKQRCIPWAKDKSLAMVTDEIARRIYGLVGERDEEEEKETPSPAPVVQESAKPAPAPVAATPPSKKKKGPAATEVQSPYKAAEPVTKGQ